MSLREKLLNGEKLLGLWGTGFVGLSSMAYFASKGVKCIGMDVDQQKVDEINKGNIPVENMEYWLGFNIKPLVAAGTMRATTDWRELINRDVAVHLICAPTERNGAPYDDILVDVIQKLTALNDVERDMPPLVIIESTLIPNRTQDVVIPIFNDSGLEVGKDILLGVAPRRDWFTDPEKTLKTLPRVVGGTTAETTDLMKEVLGIVCDTILPARDHRHAELVKSIENAYRHVEITLANQLSLAYPDIDMREVLKLVGTKWNIGTYHPSFGTGGYCIPLASQYVLAGTQKAETLTILQSTLETDRSLPRLVAESVVAKGAKAVGILGLTYRGDLKVHVLSPTIKIVRSLLEKGITVKVHDPYYSAEEIKRITETDTFDFPEGLNEFDTILIVSDHRAYQATPRKQILANLKNCRLILNNTEIWNDLDFESLGIEYHVAGTRGWLS